MIESSEISEIRCDVGFWIRYDCDIKEKNRSFVTTNKPRRSYTVVTKAKGKQTCCTNNESAIDSKGLSRRSGCNLKPSGVPDEKKTQLTSRVHNIIWNNRI